MSYFFNTIGTVLSAVAAYQVLTDAHQQPIVSGALGFSLGYFGTSLILKVLNELE